MMVVILALACEIEKKRSDVGLSIEDSASAVASPAAMLAASTPVSRVKLERFGKASVVLACCSGGEESGDRSERV